MKKIFIVMMMAVAMTFVACGPSAEEVEKAKQDSIAKADSIALIEKVKADSIVAADTVNVDTITVVK